MIFIALTFFTSCSNGTQIPQPVCEYGQAICQTLTFLCSTTIHWNDDHTLADSLYKDLQSIDKRLKLYEKVIKSHQ